MQKFAGLFIFLMLVFLIVAYGSSREEVAETAVPTLEIATATNTLEPTETSAPTETTVPPTEESITTATPAKPTNTPTPDRSIPTAQPLSEGNEIDAMQLVLNSEERVQNLETIQYTENTLVVATSFSQQTTQHCAIEGSDRAYCRTSIVFIFGEEEPEETFNEVVQLGEQIWFREGDGEWLDVTIELAESGVFAQEAFQQLAFSEFMMEVELVGETTIDGVLVYEVAFSLDAVAYASTILSEEFADIFASSAGENEATGRIWIGQMDMLARKMLLEMPFVILGENVRMTIEDTLFGFDEPVEIPDPTAEQQVFKS